METELRRTGRQKQQMLKVVAAVVWIHKKIFLGKNYQI